MQMKEMQRQITNLKQLMAIKDKKKNVGSQRAGSQKSNKDLFASGSHEVINFQRSDGFVTPQLAVYYKQPSEPISHN